MKFRIVSQRRIDIDHLTPFSQPERAVIVGV